MALPSLLCAVTPSLNKVMKVPAGSGGARLKLKVTATEASTVPRFPLRSAHCVPLNTATPGAAVDCIASPALVEGRQIALLGSPGGYS